MPNAQCPMPDPQSPLAAFIQAPSIWPYLKYAHEALGRRLFRNASQGNVNQLTNDPGNALHSALGFAAETATNFCR